MATLSQQKPCVTNTASSSYFASYSGTYEYNFSSSIPSNATITSVTFTANTHYLKTSMSGTYYVSLLSSSSDTTGTVGSNVLTLSHTSTSQKSLSGTVWTANSSIINKIKSGTFYCRLMRQAANSGTCQVYYGGTLNNTSKGLLTCTVTYSVPSVSTPTNVTIAQHPTNGTYTISWDPCTGSGGSGSVTYQIWNVSDGLTEVSGLTSTSYTASLPGYGYYYEYKVYAIYSGTSSAASSVVGFYANTPLFEGTDSITQIGTSGTSVTLSWPPSVLTWSDGDISYRLYYKRNDTSTAWLAYGTVGSNTSVTITEDWFKNAGQEGDTFYFSASALATNLTNNINNLFTSMTCDTPLSTGFTYLPANSVAYHDGTSWVECDIYYHDGATWVPCKPYYHNGTAWEEINTSIT